MTLKHRKNTPQAYWHRDAAMRLRKASANELFRATAYRSDVVVHAEARGGNPDIGSEKRGIIRGIPTRDSLRRMIFTLNNCDSPMQSMLTVTHTDRAERDHDVMDLIEGRRAVIRFAKKTGAKQIIWVREFQKNASVHWHIFTDFVVGSPGDINHELGMKVTRHYADHLRRKKLSSSCWRKMIHGDGKGFRCCRWEQLKDAAAGGRYCGKEGAKRFQKMPPPKWWEGGGWWRATANVTVTPITTGRVRACDIAWSEIMIDDSSIDVPCKLQYGMTNSIAEMQSVFLEDEDEHDVPF